MQLNLTHEQYDLFKTTFNKITNLNLIEHTNLQIKIGLLSILTDSQVILFADILGATLTAQNQVWQLRTDEQRTSMTNDLNALENMKLIAYNDHLITCNVSFLTQYPSYIFNQKKSFNIIVNVQDEHPRKNVANEEKYRKRKERNRLSAQQSRQRKRDERTALENKLTELESERSGYLQELAVLIAENNTLKSTHTSLLNIAKFSYANHQSTLFSRNGNSYPVSPCQQIDDSQNNQIDERVRHSL